MVTNQPTVLIVDDDPQVRQLFSAFLEDQYHVMLADSGDAALRMIDDDVDVVLLDRRMVGLSGGDVLLRLREEGYDVPVAMVTAVEPDFDIFEMGFDDYLVKPIQREDLLDLVETQILRLEYDDVIREYFALVSKVTALERHKQADELADNDAYVSHSQRLEEIKEHARVALDTAIEAGKFDELFQDLELSTTQPHSYYERVETPQPGLAK